MMNQAEFKNFKLANKLSRIGLTY